VANSVVSIDQEIMFVCAASGNTLTIGTTTVCPSTGGRGYDGTTAASHALGPCSGTNLAGCVVGNVVAKHHNAMKDEIKAIEQALGPNLANVNLSQPVKYSLNYVFPPQSPGGSLIAGNNTITMTPVPAGVSGTDTNHRLYVSGGTGTAEACLITGGSAVSGSPSGTLIINCANAHSGAWTIQTATAGIQEAANQAPNGSTIQLAGGNLDIYAAIYIAFKVTRITGSGPSIVSGTQITPHTAGQDIFDVYMCEGCMFDRFAIVWGSAQTSGSDFNENQSVAIIYQYLYTTLEWITINQAMGQGNDFIDHCHFNNFQNAAIILKTTLADNTGSLVTNNLFDTNTTAYFPTYCIQHLDGGGTYIAGNGFHASCRYGVYSTPGGASSQLQIVGNTFDAVYGTAVYIAGGAGGTQAWTNYVISSNVIRNFLNNGSAAFHGATGFQGIVVNDIYAEQGIITGNQIEAWTTTAPSTGLVCMIIDGTDWQVSGNSCINASYGIEPRGAVTMTLGTNRIFNALTAPYNPVTLAAGNVILLSNPFPMTYAQATSATHQNGSIAYISDATATCAAGGSTGQMCFFNNGAWAH
jgi:hypothetical protein